MDFLRAPLIVRNHRDLRDYFVEGDVGALTPNEVDTFRYGCESFGFLVPVGQACTGGQWIRIISAAYDVENPKTAEVVRVLSKGMLVEDFKGDRMVIDASGAGRFYGSNEECLGFLKATGEPGAMVFGNSAAHQMRAAMSGTLDFYQIPNSLRLPAFRSDCTLPADAVRERALGLLMQSPIHPERLTDDEVQDVQAQKAAMKLLVGSGGYGGVVTYSPPRAQPKPKPKEADGVFAKGHPLGIEEIEESMHSFIGNMLDRGWDPSDKLFLCRPAPIFNPLGSIQPHESMVHPRLIGWRVLSPIVQRLVERAQCEAPAPARVERQAT